MKALLIDVEEKRIREVELIDTSTREQTAHMHKLIGCETFTCVQLSAKLDLWVDDEGLLQKRTKGFLVAGRGGQPIMGNGLITGPANYDGEITAVWCTPDQVQPGISFIDYDSHTQVPIPPVQVFSM